MSAARIQSLKVLEVCNVDFALHHFILPVMRKLRSRGHDVVGVCADGPLLQQARVEGFRIEAVPMARSMDPIAHMRTLRSLVDIMRREKPDLVHAHMPISGLLARAAARIAGVPKVAYTCHGFLFNQPGPAWRRHLSLSLERLAGRMTDIYLTVSEEDSWDARRLGIHPGAIPVLNGRDPNIFCPDQSARAAIRAELGASPEDCVVIAVARLVRHKGWPELLKAMERTPPHCVLWAVGNRLPSDHGEHLDAEFDRAAAILGRRLVRLGYREDVPRLLAASDVFCLPSHFEGLPMSVIEAMLTGLPVVAADIQGSREQVVHEETGILVPPTLVNPLSAALARLAEDGDTRIGMGVAGRKRALARFVEADVLSTTAALLEKVTHGYTERAGRKLRPDPVS